MFVSLDFAGQAGTRQLVVPSEAVIVTGERNVVIVARDDGGFDVAEVTVGAEADGRTAILSGSSEGQSIVLSGQFLIDSEASLQVRRSRARRRARSSTPRSRAMIARLIRWSLANRFLVLLATLIVAAWGVWAVLRTPLDALPDLSDVQVIIRTPYPGPGAAHRRGPGHLSADDDDAVGARREDRARLFVLRRLVRLRAVRGRHRPVLGALARARVPEPGAEPPAAQACSRRSGPDATGVGWIYEYALVDRSGQARPRRSCARCRTGS